MRWQEKKGQLLYAPHQTSSLTHPNASRKYFSQKEKSLLSGKIFPKFHCILKNKFQNEGCNNMVHKIIANGGANTKDNPTNNLPCFLHPINFQLHPISF